MKVRSSFLPSNISLLSSRMNSVDKLHVFCPHSAEEEEQQEEADEDETRKKKKGGKLARSRKYVNTRCFKLFLFGALNLVSNVLVPVRQSEGKLHGDDGEGRSAGVLPAAGGRRFPPGQTVRTRQRQDHK